MAIRPVMGPGFSDSIPAPVYRPIDAGDALAANILIKHDRANDKTIKAGQAALTAIFVFGTSLEASTSADTKTKIKVQPALGTIFEAEISEIENETELTATDGDTTSFIDDSLTLGADDVLIGSVWKVAEMASGEIAVGVELTCTDYANSTGDMTLDTSGETVSTGFAAGDKLIMVKVGSGFNDYAFLECDDAGAYIVMDGHSGAGDWCRQVGRSDDNTTLFIVITSGGRQGVTNPSN